MNILSTLFIVVFFITQMKSESILLDCSDCQTKFPIRRQTIRAYPPGTALFIGDECVCGGAQETIYEYIPPAVQSAIIGPIIPSGLRPRTIAEPLRSKNRAMGNYGSLVFSANVQILNLLSLNDEDLRKDSHCNPKNLVTAMNATTTTFKNILLAITPKLLPWFLNVTEKFTTGNIGTDETGVTDEFKTPMTETGEIVSTTTPLLQFASPTLKECTSENIGTSKTDVTDEFKTPMTETGEIVSTTTPLLQFASSTVKECTTENIRTDTTYVTDEFNTPTMESGEIVSTTTPLLQFASPTVKEYTTENIGTDRTDVTDKRPTTETGERAVTETLRNITTSKMYNNIFSHRVKEHFVLFINDGFA